MVRCSSGRVSVFTAALALGALPGSALAAANELVYFSGFGNDKVFAQVAAEFAKANPGVSVKEIDAAGSGDQLDAVVKLTLAGQAPDVIIMPLAWYSALGQQGILADINPLLAKDSAYKALKPKLFTNLLDRFQTPEGKLYALPVDINLRMLFYNKAHFSEAGLSNPPDDWTWDGFAQAARKLTQKSGDGTVSRWGFQGFGSGVPSSWLTWVKGNGGDVVDRWVDPTRSTFSAPRTVTAFEQMLNLIDLGGAPDWNGGSFDSQKVSMALSWIEDLYRYETVAGLDYAMVPQPTNATPYTAMGVRFIGIDSGSKNPELAYRFRKFFSTSETAQRLLGVRKVSWVKPVAADPELIDTPKGRNKPSLVTAMAHADVIYPLTPYWVQLSPIYQKQIRDILARKVAYKNAADQIDQAANAVFAPANGG